MGDWMGVIRWKEERNDGGRDLESFQSRWVEGAVICLEIKFKHLWLSQSCKCTFISEV